MDFNPKIIPGAQSMKNWVYVGSIFWDLTEDDLRTVFSAIGPVQNCILPPNPETGKHKGHAFVEFEEEEHAEEAKRTIDGMELAGRNLRVGLCTSTWPLQYLASTKGGAVSVAAESVAARVGRGVGGVGGVGGNIVTNGLRLQTNKPFLYIVN